MTNNKELFLKWTKNLYYVQIVALVCSILAAIPLIGTIFSWICVVLSAIVVYILYQLSPVKDRYRKAAIFMGISVVAGLLTNVIDFSVIALVVSICSFVGTYQEYCGHSEMMDGIDHSLGKKWHSLFNWQFFGGIVLGVLGAPIVAVLAALFLADANLLTAIVLILVTCFDTVIRIFYLIYLKRTREEYEAFPSNMEEGKTVDYI